MEKYVLITGGTKGIGKAIAECLGKSGYNLILTYASDKKNAVTVQHELEQHYSIFTKLLQADITQGESVEKINRFLIEENVYLDALIFNAGMTCRSPFEEIKEDDWLQVFYANVHFPVFLMQRIITRMKAGGSIVFTGSLMGIEAHSVSLAYGVTKSAVHALVKNLVKFLVPYQIRVNAVAPGFVDTEWQKNKPEEIRRNIERKVALGRFCDPMELAEVYKLLIENSYLNGEIIVVDGGYSYK
ncbi:SDR family NAD(P)-dependent oxidoreductase [Parabacteroides pacaensis]|uniref:SDR family NAD(P)-dependent oxidoreductase n=1 Tax=Parabacteroides pacaensis TaxID=2086575 RepID=UPI000D114954|nr:SDR family oxidoreductase [Parabacteroides pacaensis]